MAGLGMKRHIFVLMVFLFGLMSVLYLYDRTMVEATDINGKYGSRYCYGKEAANSRQACRQMHTDNGQRICNAS